DDVAGGEAERGRGVLPLQAADPEQTGIAERNRDHRRIEILLVAVLMQSHFGVRSVEINEAGLGRSSIAGEVVPCVDERLRYRRPRLASVGMVRLIAVAALVRDPAKRPAVRHAYCERPT